MIILRALGIDQILHDATGADDEFTQLQHLLAKSSPQTFLESDADGTPQGEDRTFSALDSQQ